MKPSGLTALVVVGLGLGVAGAVIALDHTRIEPTEHPAWSTFTENRKLSDDFTAAFRDTLDPAHQEPGVAPGAQAERRRRLQLLGPLALTELRLQGFIGFKHRASVAFTFVHAGGDERSSWSTAGDRIHFPSLVQFKKDGAVVVKTNGDERRLNYDEWRPRLREDFLFLLTLAIDDELRETPKGRELNAATTPNHDAEDRAKQGAAARSWATPTPAPTPP